MKGIAYPLAAHNKQVALLHSVKYLLQLQKGDRPRTYIIAEGISSGMLIGMLQVSCWPTEFHLPRGLDGTRITTLRLRSVDEHAVPPRACRSSYIWSQTFSAVDICLYRNSMILSEARVQTGRAFRACRTRAAINVESTRECIRHVIPAPAPQVLSNSHYIARSIILVSTWLGYGCGVCVRHDADTYS